MGKVYELVAEQTDKTDRDNVEVIETNTLAIVKTKTVGWYKAEIAKLDAKLVAVAEAKATLEAELAALQVEVDKYELIEEGIL